METKQKVILDLTGLDNFSVNLLEEISLDYLGNAEEVLFRVQSGGPSGFIICHNSETDLPSDFLNIYKKLEAIVSGVEEIFTQSFRGKQPKIRNSEALFLFNKENRSFTLGTLITKSEISDEKRSDLKELRDLVNETYEVKFD